MGIFQLRTVSLPEGNGELMVWGPVVWDSKGAKPVARNSPLTWVFVFQLFLVDTKNRIHHPLEAPCGWTKVSGFQRRLNSP